jgi:CubicO group peptidase (beta-lactamase class C family)
MTRRRSWSCVLVAAWIVGASMSAAGQVVAGSRPGMTLTDYEGVYAYHGTATIAIVAADSMLFAVLDAAKYRLIPLGGDRVLNAGGDTIPFRRGADGRVSGFVERGTYFPRRSTSVDRDIVAAVRTKARPDARYAYTSPRDLRDGIAVGDLSSVGLDTAVAIRLVSRIVDGTYADVHSVLVHRRGRLVMEEYFYDYDGDRPHQLRSLTKSVVSILAGIALDRGLLESDTTLVTKHLPYERYANPDPRKAQLTLRDLLTMRSGLACDDWDASSPGNESRMYQSQDWVKFVLDLPMAEQPGTRGHYCSGNAVVTGRIVERTSGMPLPAFAQRQLFTPLGIRAGDVRWNYTLSASNATTFSQLYLRPRDMLKLGLLFQQQGHWNGRQIVSRDWIRRATKQWSTVGDQAYGYFWWHQWVNAETAAGPRRVDMIVATGNGGQKIYLVPSLELVVVMTGGNYNVNSPGTAIMAKEILPAVLTGMAGSRDP